MLFNRPSRRGKSRGGEREERDLRGKGGWRDLREGPEGWCDAERRGRREKGGGGRRKEGRQKEEGREEGEASSPTVEQPAFENHAGPAHPERETRSGCCGENPRSRPWGPRWRCQPSSAEGQTAWGALTCSSWHSEGCRSRLDPPIPLTGRTRLKFSVPSTYNRKNLSRQLSGGKRDLRVICPVESCVSVGVGVVGSAAWPCSGTQGCGNHLPVSSPVAVNNSLHQCQMPLRAPHTTKLTTAMVERPTSIT